MWPCHIWICELCLDMARLWSNFGTVMDLAKTAKICDRTKTAQNSRGRTWMYNFPMYIGTHALPGTSAHLQFALVRSFVFGTAIFALLIRSKTRVRIFALLVWSTRCSDVPRTAKWPNQIRFWFYFIFRQPKKTSQFWLGHSFFSFF